MDKSIPAPAAAVLDFIASVEAPKGYDTVYGNKMAQMPKPLTSMTLKEVLDNGKFRTSKFGSSACGRYQFMDATLRDLATEFGLEATLPFNPDTQDQLGYALLIRRKLQRWLGHEISTDAFMWELAKEWASFPVPADGRGAHRQVKRGETYYAGDKLNKSLLDPGVVWSTLENIREGSSGTTKPAEPQPQPTPVLYTEAQMRQAVEDGIKAYQAAMDETRWEIVVQMVGNRPVGFKTQGD